MTHAWCAPLGKPIRRGRLVSILLIIICVVCDKGCHTYCRPGILDRGWGFVTDVTDVKIRSINIIKHHQTSSLEGVVIKTRKSPILPIILNFYFINQIGLLKKNGPTMTFRCNSKENSHRLGGPLGHHFWPITTLSHISHISNTKKWPTWGRSEGVTRIATPFRPHVTRILTDKCPLVEHLLRAQ